MDDDLDPGLARLRQRRWVNTEEEISGIKRCEHDAVETATTAIREAALSVSAIKDARDAAIKEINAAFQATMDEAAEIIKSKTRFALDIDSMIQTQLNRIEQFVAARLAAVSATVPNLAPIDLDDTYREKDFASLAADSIMWAAMERRRVMVHRGIGYGIDYSRASRKPPTAMAMDMLEYYVNYPDKLDKLFQRVTRLAGQAEADPGANDTRPKSQDELDAEAYAISAGLLPMEDDA
jgi:hypothetical protein